MADLADSFMLSTKILSYADSYASTNQDPCEWHPLALEAKHL